MGGPAPADLIAASAPQLELVAVAEGAARVAGSLLAERFEAGRERALATKVSPTDLVSAADLDAQEAIRASLRARRPDDGLLAEEANASVAGTTGVRWVVDPLDGTVNFLFGIPQWCVSVAAEDGDGALAGVVYDPVRDELFAATRDGPATLNGTPITGSAGRDVATALVATGFSYEAVKRARQAEVLTRVLPAVRDIRRSGSAALDLVWTAAARHDAFYERDVRPWDVAAGALICARAGLEVLTLDERAPDVPAGILAAPAALVPALLALVG